MKMVLAILNADDASLVIHNLMKEGFFVTKLSTTGSFLRAGNVTIIVGVEADKVDAVLEIITQYSHSRKQILPTAAEVGLTFQSAMLVEVTVGGATIFVFDVERFEKV